MMKSDSLILRWLSHVWRKLLGLVIMLCGMVMATAILSYNTGDPSFNHTTSALVKNVLGQWGAHFADLVMQTFGLSFWLLIVFVVSLGLQMILLYNRQRYWILRSGILLLIMPFVSVAHAISGKGGCVGEFMLSEAQELATPEQIKLIAISAIVLGYLLACGLTLKQWRSVLVFLLRRLVALVLLVGWVLRATCVIGRRLLARRHGAGAEDSESFNMPKIPQPVIEVSPIKNRMKRAPVQSTLALPLDDFIFPNTNLLRDVSASGRSGNISEGSLSQNSKLLRQVLQDFGVNGEITKIHPGPVVTLYELEPSAGTKSSRVIGLADDIARSMSAVSARIAVLPGKNAMGIELPNAHREMVYLRELLETEQYKNTDAQLPLVLGKNISGTAVIADLARMPHLLVAGTTGSGKSVAINTMILSLLFKYSPKECQLIMIDPKMLELSVYEGIPHLLAPVVTDAKKAVTALKWVVKEMENRYRAMSSLGVRNILGYNKMIDDAKMRGEKLTKSVQTGFDRETGQPLFETVSMPSESLPFIVVIVDEMADLMIVAGKDIESLIQRLAQMARAAGIHIIMATQRPSVDVITGVIKANFPTRISFQVTSKIDSRTILGEQGAEQLLGMGDMLYMAGGGRIERVHGPFVGDREVEEIVKALKKNGGPLYRQDITTDDEEDKSSDIGMGVSSTGDDLYDQAVLVVLRDRRPTTSYLQRSLKIGYNKAATLIEQMERNGILSEPNSLGKREIMVENNDMKDVI